MAPLAFLRRLVKGILRVRQDVTHFGPSGAFLGRSKTVRQLGRTLLGDPMKIFLPGDTAPAFVRLETADANVFRQVYLEKQYDLESQHQQHIDAVYRAIIAMGKVPIIIDCGANIGASVRFFASRFPKARIHAVEPLSANCKIMRLNVENLDLVRIWEAGISNSPGELQILDADAATWAIQTVRKTQTDQPGLPAIDIASILKSEEGGELFYVKIDIEGFERDLFEANTDWVHDCPVVVVEPHDWLFPGAGTSHSLQRTMALQARDLVIKGENLFWIDMRALDRINNLPVTAGHLVDHG